MTKTAERQGVQREALIDAAEQTIAEKGLAALKARDLAAAAGVSLGGVYNLVGDLDELVFRVAARTLARLDAALTEAAPKAVSPCERLVAIAIAYCRFARKNLFLWRALFDHRMATAKILPDWQAQSQWRAYAHIDAPLRALLPDWGEEERALLARTLFAAVHGVVALGLEEKLMTVPVADLETQIEKLIVALCVGLKAQA